MDLGFSYQPLECLVCRLCQRIGNGHICFLCQYLLFQSIELNEFHFVVVLVLKGCPLEGLSLN